jgi:photosystem II stability/assembly factor-like uncharacterized protein
MSKKQPLWVAALLSTVMVLTALPAHGGDLGGARPSQQAGWVPTHPVEPQSFQYLDLFEDGAGYATTIRGAGYFMQHTADSGITWENAPPLPAMGPTAFGTSSTGYLAAGSGGLWTTRDGAQSWKQIPSLSDRKAESGYGKTDLDSVAAEGRIVVVGGSRAKADTECALPSDAEVVLGWSRDGGTTWREASLPFYGRAAWMNVLDARNGVAIVYDDYTVDEAQDCQRVSGTNAVYRTKDAGRSWQKIMDCRDGLICTSAAMADRNTILVGTNEARLFRSEDRGRTFEEVTRLSNPAYSPLESLQAFWIAGLEFADPSVGYASTKGGGTYRTTDGGKTWVLEHSTELVWGLGVGDLAVSDAEHAIAGGPNFLITRVPTP